MNLRACLLVLFIIPLMASAQRRAAPGSNEIIYHVFLRSFYDSNGDGHGDLKGLQQKLDYLQQLGITTILMLPIQSSPYYHNYFSDDFRKIDPEFGDMKSYLELVKEVHRRKMRIYLDIETQYVIEDHPWWKESYNNPSSRYSDYILYNDENNTKPEPIIFNLTAIPGYNGVVRRATTVNLLNKDVLAYNIDLFKFWIDPNGDGKFDDGADGFRLDHAMDDLDWKGKLTGLLEKFWKPLIAAVKKVNPDVTIVAEQSYWADYGKDYFEKAGVDMVFGFQAHSAFVSFDKQKLQDKLDSTLSKWVVGKQVIFIENHDIPRFSSVVNKKLAKEKIGAALNLLCGGVPSIYYGQELGMYGKGGFGKFGGTDGNDIPMREAFEWYRDIEGKGMALWYKDSGPWWDSTNLEADDGISVEEGMAAPGSLLKYYKQLIALRKAKYPLNSGYYKTVLNNNDSVFSFLRHINGQTVLVMINLSGSPQRASLTSVPEEIVARPTWKPLLDKDDKYSAGKPFSMKAYQVQAWEIL
jgi:alpha-amylase